MVSNFLHNVDDTQTNKQTNGSKNITSLTEVIMSKIPQYEAVLFHPRFAHYSLQPSLCGTARVRWTVGASCFAMCMCIWMCVCVGVGGGCMGQTRQIKIFTRPSLLGTDFTGLLINGIPPFFTSKFCK